MLLRGGYKRIFLSLLLDNWMQFSRPWYNCRFHVSSRRLPPLSYSDISKMAKATFSLANQRKQFSVAIDRKIIPLDQKNRVWMAQLSAHRINAPFESTSRKFQQRRKKTTTKLLSKPRRRRRRKPSGNRSYRFRSSWSRSSSADFLPLCERPPVGKDVREKGNDWVTTRGRRNQCLFFIEMVTIVTEEKTASANNNDRRGGGGARLSLWGRAHTCCQSQLN